MKLTGEPTMDQIDDYDNKETPEKRKTIRIIIIALLIIGAISYALIKYNSTMPDDYIGTTEEPGIVSTKVF
ncbi:MAG: Unknown protein [uncultured Sulfurovum sp.]|uniref:Uncharacterized protein n=1 Tax=uncultured Sulfurovum sp. TaxID=269237 RepID=A0A6S6THR9_9BACT|nr:MAG: Unknown protein [uncultured Sulfurovum sp.]